MLTVLHRYLEPDAFYAFKAEVWPGTMEIGRGVGSAWLSPSPGYEAACAGAAEGPDDGCAGLPECRPREARTSCGSSMNCRCSAIRAAARCLDMMGHRLALRCAPPVAMRALPARPILRRHAVLTR